MNTNIRKMNICITNIRFSIRMNTLFVVQKWHSPWLTPDGRHDFTPNVFETYNLK